MSYWCPNQLEYMALPACHLYYQWVTNVKTKELSCFYLCRSNDWFLGKSQNDIMASLLTHYLAKLIGYTVKYLSYTGVDVHLYTNHIDQAKELIKREPRQLPELVIKKDINTLDDILNLEFDDIELINYNPYPVIKASMVI